MMEYSTSDQLIITAHPLRLLRQLFNKRVYDFLK